MPESYSLGGNSGAFIMQAAYKAIRQLQRGGMAELWLVEDLATGRLAVMKTVATDVFEDPSMFDRFRAEHRMLAALSHVNIVDLYGVFYFNQQRVMVMEYIDGVSLEHRLRSDPMPLAEALHIAWQVLSALEYVHAHGIIHRDLKPSNLMLNRAGAVKVLDFGIAKSKAEPTLTFPGMTMGSVHYMSPEQVRGMGVDARSDLYSFGAVLYEMLTGQKVFSSDSSFGVMEQHLHDSPVPPALINGEVNLELNAIILKTLAKDPHHRFCSAQELSCALQEACKSSPSGNTVLRPRQFRLRITRPLFSWTRRQELCLLNLAA